MLASPAAVGSPGRSKRHRPALYSVAEQASRLDELALGAEALEEHHERERTRAGQAAARARGRRGGRPKKLATAGKVAMAQQFYADKTNSIADICRMLGISRATLYRYVETARDQEVAGH